MNYPLLVAIMLMVSPYVRGKVEDFSRTRTERGTLTVEDLSEVCEILPAARSASVNKINDMLILSPGRKRVAAVTKKGCVKTGLNEYRLICWDADALSQLFVGPTLGSDSFSVVAAHHADGMMREEANAIATVQGIHNLVWASDERLFYVGADKEGFRRVYSADLLTGEVVPVTSSEEGYIVHFDVGRSGDVVVYVALVPTDARVLKEYLEFHTIGSAPLKRLVPLHTHGLTRGSEIRIYVKNLFSGDTREIALEQPIDIPQANRVRVSPCGRYAIVKAYTRCVPRKWLAYDPNCLGFNLDAVRICTDGELLEYRRGIDGELRQAQFMLVVLETGLVKPLIDAPTSMETDVEWAPDSSGVVIKSQVLPIGARGATDGVIQPEPLVYIDIRDGKIERLPIAEPVEDVRWLQTGHVTAKLREGGGTLRISKSENGWESTQVAQVLIASRSVALSNGVVMEIAENPCTPPDVLLKDANTGERRRITDLNPELRNVALVRPRNYQWKLDSGIKREGRIYVPEGVIERMPLVIQVTASHEGRFTLGGGDMEIAPFSAQLLCQMGFVVLCVGSDGQRVPEGVKPKDHFVALIDGAVKAMDKDGIIDTHKMGIVGFSQDGCRVHQALAFGASKFKAAMICDSFGLTTFNTTAFYDRLGNATRLIGAYAPWGEDGRRMWLENSYLFHLDKIDTAILYEDRGPEYPSQWEPYVILRARGRPVEMFRQIRSRHACDSPLAAFRSRSLFVDWMRYWILEEIDNDPQKMEQWQRWQLLRKEAVDAGVLLVGAKAKVELNVP